MDKEMEKLKNVPLFKNFSAQMLEEFSAAFKRVSYKAGEIIFREKSEGDTLFVIVGGQVVIEKGLDEASRDFKQLAILSDGEFFGEMSVLEGGVRFAQARAEKDSSLYEIKRPDFLRFIKDHPENGIAVFTEILSVTARRLQHTSSELTMLFDLSGLVLREHKSAAEFIRSTVEEISIYFEGAWNFHGYAYNRFNEEFEEVVSRQAFARDPESVKAKAGLESGWLDGASYLMVFRAHGEAAGYVVFARASGVPNFEKNNLTTIFNTISSIMGSAIENIESRTEAALLRKLKAQKEII
ncbi:MAG: hypothetical protein A2X28_00920 [Elusimicrobia bacterium GWA2_56_46]|nr:MAG: hypothetical protein A2X28_00920 [Elusimicrobia bacterium GWA2_56_46]OGR55926.1 MAG: hypothetical protein A2X39_06285 [Elusimicrobia bacterium GWC2_56_31]